MAACTIGRWVGAAVAGYLWGTVPSADVVTRIATGGRTDIRAVGSGNPGGTNVAVSVGARWGAAVMAADIAKGAVAGLVGRRLAGDVGVHVGATASVIGHCYPVWNGFRGGKGVGTSVGQVLVSFPAYFPIDAAVAAATMASTSLPRRALLANSLASTTWVACSLIWWRRRWPNAWGPAPSGALPVATAVSSAVIASKFVAAERVASVVEDAT